MRTATALLVIAMLVGTAAADRKKALGYFRAGEKAYQAQNFEAAAINFYEAYKELPLPEIAFSAAQAFRRAHRVKANVEYVRRAVELYRFYLDKVTTGGRVGDAADSLGEMKTELEKLDPTRTAAAATPAAPIEERTRLGVNVSFVGQSAEARGETMSEIDDTTGITKAEADISLIASIDGKPVEPYTMIDVTPGEHVVSVSAPGFAQIERKEVAVKGNAALIPIALQPLPATVTIQTERGARVSVDGSGVDATGPVELAAGRHVVTIVRTGRKPVARELIVSRGQVTTVVQPLEPTLRRRAVKWVVIGGGVLAVLTVGAAGGAIYEDDRANEKLALLQQGNSDPSVLDGYLRARDIRDQSVGGVWFVGGATIAVGLTAAFLYFFDTPTAEGLRVEPIAAPGVGGAQVIGRF